VIVTATEFTQNVKLIVTRTSLYGLQAMNYQKDWYVTCAGIDMLG